MPLLARHVPSPLSVDVRPGAIASLADLLRDRRISSEGKVAVVVGPGQGDQIVVQDADGRRHGYVVESNRSYRGDEAPKAEILEGTPNATLTLITCDGVFDAGRRDYSHRRVVRAASTDPQPTANPLRSDAGGR